MSSVQLTNMRLVFFHSIPLTVKSPTKTPPKGRFTRYFVYREIRVIYL